MKKIFIFLIALISFVAVSAQTSTLPAMKNGFTYLSSTAAYTLRADTAYNVVFAAIQHYPTTQDIVVRLDTLGATKHTSVAVCVYGQKSAQKEDWTVIGDTVTWARTTTDTTIVISNATANRYRSYKIEAKGSTTSGARSKLSGIEFKQWLE
jgi:hypothetical protein